MRAVLGALPDVRRAGGEGVVIPDRMPTFVATKVTTATTYHLSTEPRSYGWALCTVNDETGELSIQSDWGHWSHRWNINHLGAPSLTHFLGQRGDVGYVADKLTTREERHEFDADATVTKFRSELAKRRIEIGRRYRDTYDDVEPVWYLQKNYGELLCGRLARELWESLSDLRDVTSVELFIERFCNIEGATTHISERPWEELVHRPGHGYQVLLHGILPALRDACAARVCVAEQATA